MKKIIFIAWISYHRRAELLAEHLGAKLYFVKYGQPGRIFQAPIRYLVQAWRTWEIYRREKPTLILVQNPPIFLVLLTFIYARLFGARYVIDSHTGAFLSHKWTWSVWLHRLLSRQALTTLVHNNSQKKVIERWDCPYSVIGFTPGNYPPGEPFPLQGKFNLAVICSFVDGDEPLAEVLEAARRLPDVGFYITGKTSLAPAHILATKPDNCQFVGFLPYNQYVGLLRNVDAIMDLTKWDHTVLMGGFEALSLEKPFITSNWPILQEYFSLGTVHCPNTAEGIFQGICRTQTEYATLQTGIRSLRDQLEADWDEKLKALQELIDQSTQTGRP